MQREDAQILLQDAAEKRELTLLFLCLSFEHEDLEISPYGGLCVVRDP